MIELIDSNSKVKMLVKVITVIEYDSDKYVIYKADRSRDDVNLFVSKLVITSEGYLFKHEFNNGEKEVLDGFIKKIINKEKLEDLGINLIKVDNFNDVNYFDINKCYVTTISKSILKDVVGFYGVVDNDLSRTIVEVVDDKKVLSEGFVGNMFLIVFGILVVVFSLVVLVGVVL